MSSTKDLAKKLERVILKNFFSEKKKNNERHYKNKAIVLNILKKNSLLKRITHFRERSGSERIFWLLAFVFSFTSAVVLIYRIWKDASIAPVTVSFQSQKVSIDSFPFPAVTICNMNLFPKSKWEQLKNYPQSASDPNYLKALREIGFVLTTCSSQKSFVKHYPFAYKRGPDSEIPKFNGHAIVQEEIIDFLLKNTQPCDKLIRLCKLGEETVNCSKIFKPVITDHGKCCTFNMLPLPLLLKHVNTGAENATYNPLLGYNTRKYWSQDEIQKWSEWHYENGLTLDPSSGKKYPWTQKRAGLPFGLSVLVDADPNDYYCPSSDSKGIRYILHSPLERPQVMDLSSVAGLKKEVLVEVHPEMTTADDDIKEISIDKRDCVFGTEQKLKFFEPYTDRSCKMECVAMEVSKRCNCTPFYTTRLNEMNICHHEEADCIEDEQISLLEKNIEICARCISSCEDIVFNYETTAAELQDVNDLWFDPAPQYNKSKGDYETQTAPDWANHQVSIIHFFYGSESTVPRFRKRRYAITDIIANIGGILGLCIGFSILSLVEIVYFGVVRSCIKLFKARLVHQLWGKVSQCAAEVNGSSVNRVVDVNPSLIPIYSDTLFHINKRPY